MADYESQQTLGYLPELEAVTKERLYQHLELLVEWSQKATSYTVQMGLSKQIDRIAELIITMDS